MRWVALVGAVVGLGGLVLAWSWRGSRSDATAATARERESSEEIAALRSELSALRAEVGRQRATSWVRTQVSAPDAAPAPASPAPPLSDEERLAADRARAAETASAVAARFRAEARDPAWSGPAAARIEDELRRSGLSGSLHGLECATTMCQVSLELDDEDSRQRLAERLAELPAFQTQVLYQHHPEARPPRVTLFVARAGHQLPLARAH